MNQTPVRGPVMRSPWCVAGSRPNSGANPSTVGANQLFGIQYRNYSITNNFTTQRGTHSMTLGGLATFEQKNENAANETHGRFLFGAGGGRTAVQNFLTGNADGLCGANCTYSEAEIDVTEHLRFNRYELYAQDTWKPRCNVTLDVGLRYSLYPVDRCQQRPHQLLPVRVQVVGGSLLRQRGLHAPHGR